MRDAPEQSHELLRKFIPGRMQPLLRGLRKRLSSSRPREEPFHTVYPFTQISPIRQENLLRLANEIDASDIPGTVVECGVLDGGGAALMAFGTAKSDRPVHLFDSWSGLPKTSEKDGDAAMWAGDVIGSPNRVRAVFDKLNIDRRRVTFHKGWFNETFPKANIDKIALLHIDADFYDSVRLTLETWVPRVSDGGYIQIDDYSAFIGCKRAVDEYLAKHPTLKLETFKDQAFFISKTNGNGARNL
jgi:O-methyltransferase